MNQLGKNINTIAIPALALVAAMQMPGTDGGPIAWAACIAVCEAAAVSATAATAGAAAASLLACVKICGFVLPLPFPP